LENLKVLPIGCPHKMGTIISQILKKSSMASNTCLDLYPLPNPKWQSNLFDKKCEKRYQKNGKI